MRIGGMASGMDTEQMVKDLMRAERVKVNKYYRQEESLKWKQEALNTTNKTLAEFILKSRSDFGLSRTTSTGTIVKSSTQNFDWVKKVSSSNENTVKATASASAMEGTHKIEVTQLAEVASVTSNDISGLLENGNFKEAYYGKTLDINGATFTIGNETGQVKSINGLVSAINNATAEDGKTSLGLRAAYDSSLGKMMINTKNQGKDQSISIGGDLASTFIDNTQAEAYKYNMTELTDTVTFNLEDGTVESFEFSGTGLSSNEKADEFINYINGNENLNNKFVAYKLGEEVIIKNVDDSNSKLEVLNGVELVEPQKLHSVGKNAQIKFNGDNIEKSSNNFSMFGVNYQLQSVGNATVNVESNVDGMMDKIKNFVEDYNALIDNLNGQLKAKSYRDYQPLIKEEKEAMTEKEIELWEEKAKSGILRNDETLTRTLQTMRNGLYDKVEGVEGFNHITQIGITTGNYQSGGKLEIDEDKLRAALNENPDGVMDLLFKKPGKDVADADKRANTGLVERLFDDTIGGMKEIVRRSGTGEDANLYRSVQSNLLIDFVTSGSISVMDKDIMNIGKRISNEERLLIAKEDRYWRKFTAMEKSMEKMNQQSQWLASQMG